MTTPKIVALFLTVLLAIVTVYAVIQHGLTGIFAYQLDSWAGIQVLLDLVIALALVMVWLVRDAKKCQRNPIPWIIITLLAGAFGPLLYILTRKSDSPLL